MKKFLIPFVVLCLSAFLFSAAPTHSSSAEIATEITASTDLAKLGSWTISGPSNVYVGTFNYSLRWNGHLQYGASWAIYPSTWTSMSSDGNGGVNITFQSGNQNTSHVLVARVNGVIKATKTIYPDIEL